MFLIHYSGSMAEIPKTIVFVNKIDNIIVLE